MATRRHLTGSALLSKRRKQQKIIDSVKELHETNQVSKEVVATEMLGLGQQKTAKPRSPSTNDSVQEPYATLELSNDSVITEVFVRRSDQMIGSSIPLKLQRCSILPWLESNLYE